MTLLVAGSKTLHYRNSQREEVENCIVSVSNSLHSSAARISLIVIVASAVLVPSGRN